MKIVFIFILLLVFVLISEAQKDHRKLRSLHHGKTYSEGTSKRVNNRRRRQKDRRQKDSWPKKLHQFSATKFNRRGEKSFGKPFVTRLAAHIQVSIILI